MLHVSDSSSVHHQEFFTVTQQWYMSYRFADSLLAGSGRNCSSLLIRQASCQQTCMTYTIAVLQWKIPDDGQRNCRKHVEFYSKNKFEELVHLVGFIRRILTQCVSKWVLRNPGFPRKADKSLCILYVIVVIFIGLLYFYNNITLW